MVVSHCLFTFRDRIRGVGNLRKSLCNKLKYVCHIQYNLLQAHLALTSNEVQTLNSYEPNLHEAILFVHKFSHAEIMSTIPASDSASPPLLLLEAVLQAQHKNLKEQIKR
eukprot:1153398-Pelagomonas_calceolata.AAC.2